LAAEWGAALAKVEAIIADCPWADLLKGQDG
jgi:hypothetical protein